MGNYLPLEIVKTYEQIENETDESEMEKLKHFGFPIKDEDDYIEQMLRMFCGRSNYQKQLFSTLLMLHSPSLNALGISTEINSMDDISRIVTDIFDVVLRPTILHKWKQNKQVYKPDRDFCNALLKTENLILSRETFSHLPCKHFYIDVTGYELFQPIEGIFVDLFDIDDGIFCVINQTSKDTFWSDYRFFNFDNNKEIKMNVHDYYEDEAGYIFCKYDEVVLGKKIDSNRVGLKRDEASFFVYQLITYLSSHEPQFEESPITKSTYRPSKKGAPIKNKFSEIQMHDIGVRFGKAFREQKRKHKCSTILTKHLEQKRKSPIPHFRSAHWQRYWVGKGRTQLITKWIEPIFIGGNESGDVVIHEM